MGCGQDITLSLPASPKFLGLLRVQVGEAAELAGFSEEDRAALVLAVNEGCANIIEHCYRMDASRKIDVTIRVLPDGLQVNLRDFGTYLDLNDFEVAPARGARPGGQGLKIMRKVMDRVVFSPAEPRGTLLSMTKFKSSVNA